MAILLALGSSQAEPQSLPFAVTIVDWQRDQLDRQRRAYRSEGGDREVLVCVSSWTTAPAENGVERVVITGVHRERGGRAHRIGDVGADCLAADGTSLPTIHTHSDGNCQFSPSDLIAIVARAGPFDGVQCGERHFIWIRAWQVVAIATSVERARLAHADTSR